MTIRGDQMPRKPRIHYYGALYHVIVRGNNREYVFNEDFCKEEYLMRLKRYAEKYEAIVYGYMIMDNHVHLLIEVTNTPLSKIMQLIQQTYTTWYNRKFNRSGHVFEQRYKSLLVNKDQYLLGLLRYIHQNPVRAGISDINYKYSSHLEYAEGKRGICDTLFVLSVLTPNEKEQVAKYVRFMNVEETEIKEKDPYHLSPTMKEIRSKVNEIAFDKMPMSKIVNIFEEENDIEVDALKGKYKTGHIKELRDALILELLRHKCTTQNELGAIFGISHYTISRIYNDREFE